MSYNDDQEKRNWPLNRLFDIWYSFTTDGQFVGIHENSFPYQM